VFVGRTDDEEAQTEALRLLKVPNGVGYEQMLGTLSPRPRHDDRPDDTPRQFIFADGHGGVEKIRIDLEAPHLEHVREALDTNPDASRVSARGVPAATGPAAVRAPDEPAPRPAPLAPPVARFVRPGPDLGSDLGDDLDDEFTDLDDPDGLLTGDRGGPGGRASDRYGRPGPELRDDEHLDLAGDVDPGDDDAVHGGNGHAGLDQDRVRAAGEAVR
jgi:hypothetical protein